MGPMVSKKTVVWDGSRIISRASTEQFSHQRVGLVGLLCNYYACPTPCMGEQYECISSRCCRVVGFLIHRHSISFFLVLVSFCYTEINWWIVYAVIWWYIAYVFWSSGVTLTYKSVVGWSGLYERYAELQCLQSGNHMAHGQNACQVIRCLLVWKGIQYWTHQQKCPVVHPWKLTWST